MPSVVAVMVVIVAIGLLVNAVVFRPLEKSIQRRWGTGTEDWQSERRPQRQVGSGVEQRLGIAK
jgi:hypothetical protein